MMNQKPSASTDQTATAKKITRLNSKTFFFASLFLSKEKSAAAYSVYAVCRISDDLVDGATRASGRSIEAMRRKILDAYADGPLDDPIMIDFRKTVKAYRIPVTYFEDLIAGMHLDLTKDRYQNFSELYDYCYKVAGVIGLIMLKIFDGNNPAAEPYAVKLGVAMQLTNIIRDIKEDYGLGRIYLPREELERFGVTEQNIAQGDLNENMKALLRFAIDRARANYRECLLGIAMLRDRRCRFVIHIMKELYAGILDAVERNGLDVFSRRAYMSMFRKIAKTIQVALTWPFD